MKSDWRRRLLSEDSERKIESRVAELEKKTGAELKIAILRESDPYFAASMLFTLISTFVLSLLMHLELAWLHSDLMLAGLDLAILLLMYGMSRIPFFKRAILSSREVSMKVDRNAFLIFHKLGVHETTHRSGAFLLVSVLEHKFEVLLDKELAKHVPGQALEDLIQKMSARFKGKDFEAGLILCIETIETHLLSFIPKDFKPACNEISNKIHWDLS